MEKKPDILDLIKGFVERPRRSDVGDRVAHFFKRASSKGEVVEKPQFEQPEIAPRASRREEAVMEFFAPVGHRPLFEQEILFLMNEGISYADIMRMPIYLRKKLIEHKTADKNERAEEPSDPLYEQARAAQRALGEPEPSVPGRDE